MMYPLQDGKIEVIQGDEQISINFYIKSLKLKKVRTTVVNVVGVNLVTKPLNKVEEDKDLIAPL